jgi:hypothetical protein
MQRTRRQASLIHQVEVAMSRLDESRLREAETWPNRVRRRAIVRAGPSDAASSPRLSPTTARIRTR